MRSWRDRMLLRGPISSGPSLVRAFEGIRAEVLVFSAVFFLAAVIRLVSLGTVPENLTADELEDLQNVYRVLEGTARGGFFGLDWTPGPAFNMYVKAGFVELFGDGVAASRLYSVAFSLIALVVFYLVARQRLMHLPALLAAFLFATSLWFLHFSRTSWTSVSSLLAGLLIAYTLELALTRKTTPYFVALGCAVAFGAYGYFSGRTLILAVVVAGLVAIFLQIRDREKFITGFVLAGIISFVLFLPQLETMLDNWDLANQRVNSVSVFNIEDEYLGDTDKTEIIFHQTLRAIRGFILLDKSVDQYGLWARYHPADWAFLDQATGVIYWIGLAVGVLQWRRFVYWWIFLLVPLFATQVFSVGTPDASRGLVVAPFMFLFAGVGVEAVLGLASSETFRRSLAATAVVVVLAIGAFNVDRYFSWIEDEQTLRLRGPAVHVNEFSEWQLLAKQASKDGRLLSKEEWDRHRENVIGRERADC
jgi:4-amino-4-deoxy-L-arabinose transferase-like glycosyltransferase